MDFHEALGRKSHQGCSERAPLSARHHGQGLSLVSGGEVECYLAPNRVGKRARLLR